LNDSTLAIVAVPPDSERAIGLMKALDDELRSRYPGVEIHGLRAEDVRDRRLVFLVVLADDHPVACGAVRELQPGVGEVKRMFVRPEWRRRGIARRLLTALELKARDLGYEFLRIETGVGQPEAIALYQSAGYTAIPPFGVYIGNPASVCFEKRLVGG
jgi:putative acetyltransferase